VPGGSELLVDVHGEAVTFEVGGFAS
jgi:hypothetical protein